MPPANRRGALTDDAIRAPDFDRIQRVVVDVDLSNRCNASCEFCPRDRTPHEGSMRPDVWARALERVVELRDAGQARGHRVTMSFCGLGEGMLNPHAPDYVASAVAVGFEPAMCANGSLLDERRSRALVDAGLRRIFVNCGDVGEDYERTYGLPFERLRRNLERFQAITGDRCELHVVLVDHQRDPARVARVRRYWEGQGVVHFFRSPMLNRSGSLDVIDMSYPTDPDRPAAVATFDAHGCEPLCAAPLVFPFIGYDGRYYLCSSDWERRGRFGTVFDRSIDEVMADKVRYQRRSDAICRTCNHDPVNRVIHARRESREDHGGELGYEPAITAVLLARHTATLERFVAHGIGGDRSGTGPGPASLSGSSPDRVPAPPSSDPVPVPAPRRRPDLTVGG